MSRSGRCARRKRAPAAPANTKTVAEYGALVGSGASYAGVDQGIDFTGGPFDVFALGDALITRVVRGGSGWPGEGAVINYRILSGPAAGKHVYVAEDFAPRADLRPGLRVKRGESLGRATGSGKAPGIEVGWSTPSGLPLAPRPAPRPANQYTALGEDFRSFVAGGAHLAPGSQVRVPGNGAVQDAPGRGSIGAPVRDAASEAVDTALAVPRFLGKLADPHNILRGLQIVAGAVLVLVGLVLLTRQVALAADVPIPDRVPLPGGRDLYQSSGYAKG